MFIVPSGIPSSSGYTIENAVLLDGSAYTQRTVSGRHARIMTWDVWVKRAGFGANNYIWRTQPYGSVFLRFTSDDTIEFYAESEGTPASYGQIRRITTAVYRDFSAWYHITVGIDGNQTDNTCCKIEVNGEEITDFAGGGSFINPSVARDIEGMNDPTAWFAAPGGSDYFNGYAARCVYIDGVKYQASDFSETNDEGINVPIDITGLTYGGESCILDFADSSDFGNDVSGLNNDYTDSGLATSDQVKDTPGADSADDDIGNYCTMSPLWAFATMATLTDGNLGVTLGTNTDAAGTIGVSSGKWYFEWSNLTWSGSRPFENVGISSVDDMSYANGPIYGRSHFMNPQATNMDLSHRTAGSNTVDVSGTTGDFNTTSVIGVAVDLDNDKIWWSVGGTWGNSGDPDAGTNGVALSATGHTWVPFVANESGSQSGTGKFNFGATTFAYPIGAANNTSGFKPISTANLPESAIKDPSQHHQVELVTHDGSSTAFTCNWNADTYDTLFIIKNRESSESWYWIDGLNGYNKYMASDNDAQAQQTDSNVISVSGTTITLGSTLASDDYVVECHKAGAAGGASLSGGGIQINSTASANTTSGFSIVKFVGTEVNGTVATGLSTACDFVVNFNLGTGRLSPVYHSSTTYTKYLYINTDTSANTDSDMWYAAPTATLMGVGTHSNVSEDGNNHVMYCWHGVENYSKFGSFVGSGNSSGPFIPGANMTPASIMMKSSTASERWILLHAARNTYNGVTSELRYDTNAAESSPAGNADILSNGVKIRSTQNRFNQSSAVILYGMWGGTPFGGDGVAQARAR